MNYIKLLYNPNYFPFGADSQKCYPINNNTFYKKFRKESYDNFNKTIFYLRRFHKYNFTPKIIRSNKQNLELYISNCGSLLQINSLPSDWELQLLKIKNIFLEHNLIILDWGLWKFNPFIINNLTIKNNKIYFVDMGDIQKSNKKQIEYDFDYKIKKIKLILKWKYYYSIIHYFEMIYLSKKIRKIFLFYLTCKLFYFLYYLIL